METDIVRRADILGHSSINIARIYTMKSSHIPHRQTEKMECRTSGHNANDMSVVCWLISPPR